jgi:hypothetical protein
MSMEHSQKLSVISLIDRLPKKCHFCPGKSGFLDVNNENLHFLIQENITITKFSAKINCTGVKRIR